MRLKRTHHCGELNASHAGSEVVLSGWVNSCRHMGGLVFIDLRDREGVTQLVANPAEAPAGIRQLLQDIRDEWVLSARGTVQKRPDEMVNPERATGEIEVHIEDLAVENRAAPMPFHLEDPAVTEDLRLKYRYLDMRRSALGRNLRLRHKVAKVVRDFFDEEGFVEIETPILSKSTPEGARDYVIPSRVHPGSFYALPQAPQQYKQILMVAGLEKYVQIARCFRDEDLRADRQPEFTQIDVEMSFVDQDDIIDMIERMLVRVMREVKDQEVPRPFPRLSHREAMDRFGSDKPDIRFGMELVSLTDALRDTSFRVFQNVIAGGGIIKAICAPGQAPASKRKIDEWTETAKTFGAKGLAALKVAEDGTLSGQITKFLSNEERTGLLQATAATPGDLLLIVADKPAVVNAALGRLRVDIADETGMIPEGVDRFLWVVEFPLVEYDEDAERYSAVHHPFTSPLEEDLPLLETDTGSVRAQAYDVVLNGVELGGGSIRIHQSELQQRMFGLLGIDKQEAHARFGHLLDALGYGAPPHGGIALGFDRMVMLIAGASSIREVIAFPKTTRAACLMTDSPSQLDPEQLEELHIRCVPPEGKSPNEK